MIALVRSCADSRRSAEPGGKGKEEEWRTRCVETATAAETGDSAFAYFPAAAGGEEKKRRRGRRV